CLQSKDSPYTF
nr:immunoglobulin light chain junction region [Macaca mulatta]MOW08297.1 immunoglobulin light chain junction region [Macaca mulatta]MOW10490.1 immunoglobulin light chain junction region [Macaca mulatta]MOX85199.1 immunoglobulin light chain junction region [Macaca mulatta]MOX85791.1 immunoglobulin light chain junction region [Macaca mulatta]